jgi:hypothetical protein
LEQHFNIEKASKALLKGPVSQSVSAGVEVLARKNPSSFIVICAYEARCSGGVRPICYVKAPQSVCVKANHLQTLDSYYLRNGVSGSKSSSANFLQRSSVIHFFVGEVKHLVIESVRGRESCTRFTSASKPLNLKSRRALPSTNRDNAFD